MKKTGKNGINGEMLEEYDFSKGVRGKYVKRFQKGSNVVVIRKDLARIFPTAESVNQALSTLAGIIKQYRYRSI